LDDSIQPLPMVSKESRVQASFMYMQVTVMFGTHTTIVPPLLRFIGYHTKIQILALSFEFELSNVSLRNKFGKHECFIP
jgi:hypothetical protein